MKRLIVGAMILVALAGAQSVAVAAPRYRSVGVELADRVYRYNGNAAALARHFAWRYRHAGPEHVARAIIGYVQNLAYIPEERDGSIPYEYRGRADWWQYPDDTLRKGGGDCEDLSILAYLMLRSVCIDAIIIDMPGHIAIGVKLPGREGTTFHTPYGDYRYVECTSPTPIGYGFPGEFYGLHRP